ncbi:hypothetical protein ACFQAT_07880 [Undibacterium arcticum]|uniref:Uncharacterized protein n=1 Tax=Undibacterium arcticum TaxID=1762892 RepID=A0ABV7EZV6_9BURK
MEAATMEMVTTKAGVVRVTMKAEVEKAAEAEGAMEPPTAVVRPPQ